MLDCEFTSGPKDCFPTCLWVCSPHLSGPCLTLAISVLPDSMDTIWFIGTKRTYKQSHSSYHTKTHPDLCVFLSHVGTRDFWDLGASSLAPPGPCITQVTQQTRSKAPARANKSIISLWTSINRDGQWFMAGKVRNCSYLMFCGDKRYLQYQYYGFPKVTHIIWEQMCLSAAEGSVCQEGSLACCARRPHPVHPPSCQESGR